MKFSKGPCNESGVILVMVLLVSLVMSIFVIGIISTNVSQAVSGAHQVDRIKAEAAVRAVDALSYYKKFNGDASSTVLSLSMDGKNFSPVTVPGGPAGSGPNGTSPYNNNVNY